MDKIGPDCIRCGLCCIAAPCDDRTVCASLHINEDLTTTCMNPDLVRHMVGPGCAIRGMNGGIYEANKEMYDLVNTKKTLLKWQKQEAL